MITLREIQKKIVEAIAASGMTQSALAAALGVSQQTVSHYVKGDKMHACQSVPRFGCGRKRNPLYKIRRFRSSFRP